MTRKKESLTEHISPAFAKKALAALDVPLDGVNHRELRLWYRLDGVAKPPPPQDGDWSEHDRYLAKLDVRNRDLRDRDLYLLRDELGTRIMKDPTLTEEELCERLREFYRSRIPDIG